MRWLKGRAEKEATESLERSRGSERVLLRKHCVASGAKSQRQAETLKSPSDLAGLPSKEEVSERPDGATNPSCLWTADRIESEGLRLLASAVPLNLL